MKTEKVYVDYNATTPLHPAAAKAMTDVLPLFGNPSSMHAAGREARNLIEVARGDIAGFIGAEANDVIFTAGGSESNNTVLKMASCRDRGCNFCKVGKNEIITTAIEHPSVLETAEYLSMQGQPVHFLEVDAKGRVKLDQLAALVSEKTALVSVMIANNEIGTIQDLNTVAEIAHAKGALVHTDAVQGLGKISIDVKKLDVDYMSFSAHKIYGPKGVGLLYSRRHNPYCPFIHGGHQEEGRRAGTLNTPGIVGFGEAVRQLRDELETVISDVKQLRDKLKQGILDRIPDAHVNGDPDNMLPNTLNVSFRGAEGEAMLLYLDLEDIYCSTGSACASGSLDPSHVLLATGLGPELAHGSLRFSLGRETTAADVEKILDKLPPIITRIRSMSTISREV